MRKTGIIAGTALVLGGVFGYLMAGEAPKETPILSSEAEKKPLYWVAPMDPDFRRDAPGKSPMGMALVPVYADAATTEGGGLYINPRVQNNIGVRTAEAFRSDLHQKIYTTGIVQADETKTSHVHVRSAGWVDRLYKKAIGETVKKGELMFELYSPDLVTAQQEYLQVVKLKAKALVQAATQRLLALGLSEGDIATLRKTGKAKERVGVRAPQDGVITMLSIGEGMHIKPGKTVYSLVDLSSVWVMADVFEAQAGLVAVGQTAFVAVPSMPGQVRATKVDYVYPLVKAKSRTVQARLVLDNEGGHLKLNMYADVTIAPLPKLNALSVPLEALIRTGKTDRIILALENGSFRPAEVLAGIESGGRIEIIAGLSAGERVVISAQFLIDSEASLSGTAHRLLGSNVPGGMDDGAAQ